MRKKTMKGFKLDGPSYVCKNCPEILFPRERLNLARARDNGDIIIPDLA